MKTNSLAQLLKLYVLSSLREPSALFWTFAFPVLLTLALGFAFRSTGLPRVAVGTADAGLAEALDGTPGLEVRMLSATVLAEDLRHGRVALVIGKEGQTLTYAFDAQRPEARTARHLADEALQKHAGRIDALQVRDDAVTAKGARYVDWLVPGLIGFQIMSGSLWGIGFNLANQRLRKMLKRFAATPMHRRDYLISYVVGRLVWLPWEVGMLAGAARLVFGVELQGELVALAVLSLVGAMSFAGIGLLVGSRSENTETASGLTNLFMLPMLLGSGVFFATSNFPAAVQPWLRMLPLTALNDALRAVFNDGASLSAQGSPLAVMAVWGAVSFAVALRLFRWT